MNNILDEVADAKSIGITGHVRPDGDCVGSCMAIYNYLLTNCQNTIIDVYLESVPKAFTVLKNTDQVNTSYDKEMVYDVFITLDCSSIDRIGHAAQYFEKAKKTICIDHHISNIEFADISKLVTDASSTCEVLYDLLEEDKIDLAIAEALYTGIIHDTGVFKHSNTTKKTMSIAGNLISKGVAFSELIDQSFYQKTYKQNQILGRCLLESIIALDGKCIISSIDKKSLEFYNATASDLDGIIDQLRVTKGIEAAILIHEVELQEYKVSMRSNGKVDVCKIAVYFGGGGHIKAAGCTMHGSLHDVMNNLLKHIEIQLLQ